MTRICRCCGVPFFLKGRDDRRHACEQCELFAVAEDRAPLEVESSSIGAGERVVVHPGGTNAGP